MNTPTSPTSDPRNYALSLVEEGVVSADHLLLCCLKAMSIDEVRWTLDANELSPRFKEEEDLFGPIELDEVCYLCFRYEGSHTMLDHDHRFKSIARHRADIKASPNS